MKSIFRKKIVQVVSGNAARNVGVTLANEIAILIANRLHPGINLATAAAFSDDGFQFGIAGRAHPHANAVVGEDFKLLNILVSLSCHHRVHAAGIVSHHAPDRAAAVRRRVGTERQVVFLRSAAQVVENHSRLDPRDAALGIKLDDLPHVFREIEHHGDVAALPGQRGASAAAEHRRAMLAAKADGGDYIVGVSGEDNSDGDLAVVGSVGGVEGAAAVVETDLAAQMAAQRGFQRFSTQHSALSIQHPAFSLNPALAEC